MKTQNAPKKFQNENAETILKRLKNKSLLHRRPNPNKVSVQSFRSIVQNSSTSGSYKMY
jgi:hypothetical protein